MNEERSWRARGITSVWLIIELSGEGGIGRRGGRDDDGRRDD